MNEITYTLTFGGKHSKRQPPAIEGTAISRIARLMALAIRFEGLVRKQTVRDYAELARRGRVKSSPHDPDHKAARSGAGHSGAAPLLASHPWPQREKPAAYCPPN